MVEQFIRNPDLEGDISPVDKKPGVYWLRLRKEYRESLDQMVENRRDYRFLRTQFARWLRESEPRLQITFNQETALENRDVSFITPLHPLAQLAVRYWTAVETPLVANLVLSDCALLPGKYVFICDLWETIGIKPEVRLHCSAWHVDRQSVQLGVGDLILQRISDAVQRSESVPLSAGELKRIVNKLVEQSEEDRLSVLAKVKERNNLLLEKRRTSLDVYHNNRLRRVELELKNAQDERIIRMKTSERDRIIREHQQGLEELENSKDPDIITQRIAAGFLEVQNA